MAEQHSHLRAHSLALLDIIKDKSRPERERLDAFQSLTNLFFGFWRPDGATTSETIRGYAIRVAHAELRSRGLVHVDADDVASEALVILYRKASQIRLHPAAWLRTVIVNRVNAYHRKERKLETIPINEDITPAPDNGGGPPESMSANVRALNAAVDALPPVARAVMRARFQDLTALEIATALGLSHEAVRQHLSRAQKKLEAALSGKISLRRAA